MMMMMMMMIYKWGEIFRLCLHFIRLAPTKFSLCKFYTITRRPMRVRSPC